MITYFIVILKYVKHFRRKVLRKCIFTTIHRGLKLTLVSVTCAIGKIVIHRITYFVQYFSISL